MKEKTIHWTGVGIIACCLSFNLGALYERHNAAVEESKQYEIIRVTIYDELKDSTYTVKDTILLKDSPKHDKRKDFCLHR